jgi:integrase
VGNREPNVSFRQGCVGLRRSEIFGLLWSDFNWLLSEVFIQRSHVEGYEDETKSESSNAKVPLHPAIVEALLAWRQQLPSTVERPHLSFRDDRGRQVALRS